jgi:hypothetical protein
MFGPKMDEVTEVRKKSHNKKLNNSCCSPVVLRATNSRGIRWVRHASRPRVIINTDYNTLVGKPERKRPHERPRDDNIKMDLR